MRSPATGIPESGQTVVNVTNGKLIRLLVDDEPFDVTYGQLRAHERCLDFRAGVLRRSADWVSPAGCGVRVSSTRLVSLVQRSIAAIRYDVQALDTPIRVVVQSELVANEQLPSPEGDPRVAAALQAPLVAEADAARAARAGLVHSTRHSGLRVAAVMDHVVDGPADTAVAAESFEHLGRVTVTATLRPGQRLRLVKFVAYGWSGSRSLPAVLGSGRRGAGRGHPDRVGRAARRAAGLPRRVLGPGRRAARRGRRDPAGGAVLAVPRVAGRGPGRGPGDRRQGPDRARLRRALLLGHRSLRAAHAHLHRARHRRGRPALAPLHPADGHRAGAPARAARRGVPVAHHSRRSMLGLLASRHGRVPHQRRHRRRRHRLPRRHRRRRLRTQLSAWSCWSKRRGYGARWVTTTPRAGSGSTASPAPTSTARSPTTTSTPT